jgi:hypothetical protein
MKATALLHHQMWKLKFRKQLIYAIVIKKICNSVLMPEDTHTECLALNGNKIKEYVPLVFMDIGLVAMELQWKLLCR